MNIGRKTIGLALDRPGLTIALALLLTLLAGLLVSGAGTAPDPAAMLAADNDARLFNEQAREEFNLHDTLILGVVNRKDENGIFNPATLKKILLLSRFAATLHDPKHPEHKVLAREILAPDRVAVMEQAGLGKVRFRWLMQRTPATSDQALAIRDRALADPLLKGSMVAADGRAMAMAIPVSDRTFIHRVSLALQAKIRELGTGGDRFYITGLPLAEATFAAELPFRVAGLSALALLLAVPLGYLFFRKTALVIPPLVIATMTVIMTMGLRIAATSSLQIISALLPLFLIPLALANSFRLLAGFVAIHATTGDRRRAVEQVLAEQATPMFRTATVSAAGFAALLLAPVPGLRIFGLFVALGIIIAWLLTMLLLPAFLMLATEKWLHGPADAIPGRRFLQRIAPLATSRPWLAAGCGLAMAALCTIGLLLIRTDGSPLQWFGKSNGIRVASRVLNSHLGGTFPAFLVLRGDEPGMTPRQAADWLSGELNQRLVDVPVIRQKVLAEISEAAAESETAADMADRLERSWTREIERLAPDDAIGSDRWSTALDSLDRLRNVGEVFKRPELLGYVAALQRHLEGLPMVGASVSVVDLVKKAHQELMEGEPRYRTIPGTVNGVAQAMQTYRNSPDAERFRHLVNRDYSGINIRLRLGSATSRDMARLVREVDAYLATNPPPIRLKHGWAGPAFMHLAWQKEVTDGIFRDLVAAFAVAFLLLSLFFRSPLWTMLAMIPPIFALAVPLAIMGFAGRNYDVPLALLSLLPLALAVDFGVHFLLRAGTNVAKSGDWFEGTDRVSQEQTMVVARSVIVVSVIFLPMLFAALRPLRSAAVIQATGAFWAGLATLWLLPSLLTLMRPRLFPSRTADPAEEEAASS